MRYAIYFALSALLFALGVYVWKAQHSGILASSSANDALAHRSELSNPDHIPAQTSVVVEVAGEKLHKDEVDWEYNLLIEGVFEKDTMTPIPDLGVRYHDELQSLRKALIASLVERKLLVAYIKTDKNFDAMDPGRFSACLNAWQEVVNSGGKLISTRENKLRLKARLCERSILEQYLKERIFSQVTVRDEEVVEYYKNHASEYRIPERVVIRQVLLPDEPAAKRVRNQINQHNFDDLAKAHSIAPEAVHGGRLGPFAKGGMPNVFDVAFHMKKGEISPILKSPYGYHVILLVDKFPSTQASLDEVRSEIQTLLRRKQEQEEYKKLVERALATVHVSTPAPLW